MMIRWLVCWFHLEPKTHEQVNFSIDSYVTISETSPDYFEANTIDLQAQAMLIFISIFFLNFDYVSVKGPDQHATPLNGLYSHVKHRGGGGSAHTALLVQSDLEMSLCTSHLPPQAVTWHRWVIRPQSVCFRRHPLRGVCLSLQCVCCCGDWRVSDGHVFLWYHWFHLFVVGRVCACPCPRRPRAPCLGQRASDLLASLRVGVAPLLLCRWPHWSSSWSGWLGCRATARRGRHSRDPLPPSQWGPTGPSPPDTPARLQSCPDNCRQGGGWCLEGCRHTGCRGWRSCCHSASCIAMTTSEGPRKQGLSLGEWMNEMNVTAN